MKLKGFITFQHDGEFFILQVREPHYIGKILRFETDEAFSFFPFYDLLAYASVPGYRIIIVFSGALNGYKVLLHANLNKELASIFQEMASFYHLERVLLRPVKFKNFLIL